MEDLRFQTWIQGEHRPTEISAEDGVCDGLRTDTWLSVIQKQTVAVDVVAALLDQPSHTASLSRGEGEE
jgi:hypothetical protein